MRGPKPNNPPPAVPHSPAETTAAYSAERRWLRASRNAPRTCNHYVAAPLAPRAHCALPQYRSPTQFRLREPPPEAKPALWPSPSLSAGKSWDCWKALGSPQMSVQKQNHCFPVSTSKMKEPTQFVDTSFSCAVWWAKRPVQDLYRRPL